MLELNTQKNTVIISEVNTNLYVAWKDGKIIFRDETLGNITKQLEKIYHVQFIYQNTKLANSYRFSEPYTERLLLAKSSKCLKFQFRWKLNEKKGSQNPT